VQAPGCGSDPGHAKLLKHGGHLASVLPKVGILLAIAAVLLTVATWRLRRTLTA